MSGRDILLLLLGGLAGAVVTSWYEQAGRIVRHLASTARTRRRLAENRRHALPKRTLSYFRSRGYGDDFYSPRHVAGVARAAAFEVRGIQVHGDLGADPSALGRLDRTRPASVLGSSQRLIRSQIRAGANIWDGEILHVDKVERRPRRFARAAACSVQLFRLRDAFYRVEACVDG